MRIYELCVFIDEGASVHNWSIGSPRSLCVIAMSHSSGTTAIERRVEDFASTLEPDWFNRAQSSNVRSGGMALTLPQKAVITMRPAFVSMFRNEVAGALLFIVCRLP